MPQICPGKNERSFEDPFLHPGGGPRLLDQQTDEKPGAGYGCARCPQLREKFTVGIPRFIVQLYKMSSCVVVDSSAILAVLLDEPEKTAIVAATMGSVLCAPASIRWQVGNAATAGVKRRRLTTDRARQLIKDFERVTIRELAVDLQRAVDLALNLGLYAYDGYILEAARSSAYPLLTLDGPVKATARKLGVSLVELDL